MPDQDPSRFEAFKSTLNSAVESIKDKTAVALIGAVGLTGGVAIAEQVNTEPANAANVPEATASDLQQDCVDEALKIKIQGAGMDYPGDRRKQSVWAGGRLNPTSPNCLPLVTREAPRIFFKMQRPKNHKAYIRTKAQTLVAPQNDYQPIRGEGGKGQVFVTASGKGGMKDAHFLYRCTPGKSITHVRAVYNLRVDSAIDGSELGHRSISVPMKVRPIPPSVVQGGGVPKAC